MKQGHDNLCEAQQHWITAAVSHESHDGATDFAENKEIKQSRFTINLRQVTLYVTQAKELETFWKPYETVSRSNIFYNNLLFKLYVRKL